MTNISCSAKNCAYNKNMACYKGRINVEGLFSRSKLGTFCESFKTPRERQLFEAELGSDMQSDSLEAFETKTDVTCSANYCVFNKNNKGKLLIFIINNLPFCFYPGILSSSVFIGN